MLQLRYKFIIQLFKVVDQLVLLNTFAVIIMFRPERGYSGLEPITEVTFRAHDIFGLPVLVIGWLCIYQKCVGYQADRFESIHKQLHFAHKSAIWSTLWLLVVSVIFSIQSITTVNLLMFGAIMTTYGWMSRSLMNWLSKRGRESGLNCKFAAIIGDGAAAMQLADQLECKSELGLKVEGIISFQGETDTSNKLDKHKQLGPLSQLKTILQNNRVDELIICFSNLANSNSLLSVLDTAKEIGVAVRIMPTDTINHLLDGLDVEKFGEGYVFSLYHEKLLIHKVVKRAFDILVSSLLLLILTPIFAIIATSVKLSSPGPILFVQERVGKNRRRFNMLKFRSMVENAEDLKQNLTHLNERDGPVFKIEKDPRITRIGSFMRKTSIDELPQLYNVLKGEMSLVGPRPPTPDEVDQYEWSSQKRLSVKPGLTCTWQVSGRKNITFERWMEMDREYIDNWSIWSDFSILLKTIPVVILGKGSS